MEGDLMKRISIGIACVGMAAISVGCGKSSPQQETSAPRVATDHDRAGHDWTAQDQPAQEPSIDQGERTIELQAQRANRAIDDVTAKADSTVERATNQAEDVSEAVDAVERAIERPSLRR
jgi:hypothetical protein